MANTEFPEHPGQAEQTNQSPGSRLGRGLAFALGFGLALTAWGGDATKIHLASRATPIEQLAAREVQRYVYLRTGTLLALSTHAPTGPAIVLRLDPALERSQYRLKTDGSLLSIAGGSDVSVLYGAYAFAEELGVRFYLHGDVLPDRRVPFALPVLDETGTPAFEIRGILPFHDFPEGPDLWAADDYKAVLTQMVKLRMNFLGLHTYTECGWGSEPTAWLGLPADVQANGDPTFSYAAHYFSTAREASGHQPRRVTDMVFGGSLLFETDPWGPPVMQGLMPQGRTLEEKNRLFVRAADLLRDVFTYAHQFGVRTCVGTEIPLTDPERLLPHELRAHLAARGLAVTDRATLKELYKGTFLRAQRVYPLDYYWLWTPESWRSPRPEAETRATLEDLETAAEAAREVQAPFTLATAGWVLGPAHDRTLFDQVLPKEMPFAALNLELGTVPVDAGFARLTNRAGWAIPWMEDDLSMTSPELWVGRIRRDAYDAHRYGCRGLLGIHWRTEEVGPMVGALAQAQWQVPQAPQPPRERPAIRVEGGETTSFGAPVADTDLDPVYQTVRYDVKAYELTVPNGSYRVTLQFNEPFYDAPGKRVFGVTLQGRTVIDQLDIFARVGKNRALDFAFDDVTVTDGILRIGFLKDIASQLIGADKAAAAGRYVEFPCIAGLVVEGPRQTLRLNCGGPAWKDYAADPGQPATPRYLPADEFYLDWARHQFGAEAAPDIARLFARIDGHLPAPAPHCPGGIAINPARWSDVEGDYAFVEELAALRPRVSGAGQLARFDRWLKSFEYLRAIAQVGCTRGELDRAMAGLEKLEDPENRRACVRREVLPVRVRLTEAWGRMMTLCLETADTWGAIGHVLTHEMFNRGTLGLLEGHDAAIERTLGTPLPEATRAPHAYQGRPRLIVPNRRTVAGPGEALTLKAIVLDNAPPRSAFLRWRPLGRGAWQTRPLDRVARAVHTVTLPPLGDETVEYYLEAETAGGERLHWPATAPDLNQTLVPVPAAKDR